MKNNCLFQLKLLVDNNILPHAILLSGVPEQTILIAQNFSKWLLCEDYNKHLIVDKLSQTNNKIYDCQCKSCNILMAQNHPDYLLIDLLDQSIKINIIREANDFVNTKPYLNDRKVLLIHNVHNINKQAANAFLKTLEEPALGNKVLILLTSNYPKMLLNTILSRVMHINVVGQLINNYDKSKLAAKNNDLEAQTLQDLHEIWVKGNNLQNIAKIVEKWEKLPKLQFIYMLWTIIINIIKAKNPGILLQIKKKMPIQSLWLSLDNLTYLNKIIILGQQINWRLFLYNFVLTIPIYD